MNPAGPEARCLVTTDAARGARHEKREVRMRPVAIAVSVLVLAAATSFANPIAIDLYVDFDPPNYVHSTYPAQYTTVNAYIAMDLVGFYGQDIYAVSFDVDMLFGNSIITGDFVPAYPTYAVQMVDNGITVIAEDCISESPATLGYVPVFYTGMPDCVQIKPHIDNGHTFVTCDNMDEHSWCYVMDGGIGMEPQSQEYCGNPVQNIAWGAIKALYR